MRLIKVGTPRGKGKDVAEVAFSVGIEKVSIRAEDIHKKTGQIETEDAVDISTSTPKSKQFIDALLKSDFYNREDFSIIVRQPRSIISGESLRSFRFSGNRHSKRNHITRRSIFPKYIDDYRRHAHSLYGN